MAITPYNPTADPGTFTVPDSALKRGSRIIGVAAIKVGFDIETLTTDPTTWDLGIGEGDVIIINPVTGNWTEASATEEAGIGRINTEFVNDEYDIPAKHRGPDANLSLWNTLKLSNDFGGLFVFEDNKAYVPLNDDKTIIPIDWRPRISSEEELQKHRMMMFNAKWKSRDFPYVIDVPGSLFPQ